MDVQPLPSLSLTPEQQSTYRGLLADPYRSCKFLAEALGLPEYKHDARSAIILDYVAGVLRECVDLHLDAYQSTEVLHIAQQLLLGCAGVVSRQKLQEQLRASLLQLCTAAPGSLQQPANNTVGAADAAAAAAAPVPAAEYNQAFQTKLLPDAIGSLAAFFVGGILQHYGLYVLVFTQQQQHVQHQHHLMVESAVSAPPLSAALAEADWIAHLAAAKAQREARQAAAEAAERARLDAEEAAMLEQQRAEEAAARQAQLERKPKTLGEAVDKLIAVRLEEVRTGLAAEYAARAMALAARVGQLEQQQQAAVQLASQPGKARAGSAARQAAM